MTVEDLNRRLRDERIVPMPEAEWAELAPDCEVMERHDTLVAGELLVVSCAGWMAAVEQPSAGERVLRRLSGADEAGRFVKDRLEAYERMWDGCGCKIDYYN